MPAGQYPASIVINLRNVSGTVAGGVEDGKIGYLFLPTVLRRKMLEAAPSVGSAFQLRYEGTVKPEGGGNAYKDWTLVTEAMIEGADPSKSDQELWNSINPDLRGGGPAQSQRPVKNSPGEWSY